MSDTQPEDLALFGGTFDPPHRGHLALIEYALTQFPRAPRLLLLPAGNPYQKGVVTPGAIRLRLLRMLLRELPPALLGRVQVDERELRKTTPSHTVDTLSAMRAEHRTQHGESDLKLWWLMGEDQWRNLPSWFEWQRLFRLSHVVILARPDESNPGPAPDPLPHIESERRAYDPVANQCGGVYRVTNFSHPANSTTLRAALNAAPRTPPLTGSSLNLPNPFRDWLTPEQLDYIAGANLYLPRTPPA